MERPRTAARRLSHSLLRNRAALRTTVRNTGGSVPIGETTESLSDSIGTEDATRAAIAYDRAVSIISLGDRYCLPSREVRRDMLNAILAAGQAHGFNEDRLTLAALVAARVEG